MNKPSPRPLVITLYKDKLAMCSPVSSGVLTLPFPAAVISDLEVIDHVQLESAVANFVTQTKLRPSPLIIVLSPGVYFEKVFPETLPPDFPVESDKFISAVPLNTVSSKLFKWENHHHLVVINRDLFESFRQAFLKLGFTVLVVVPGFILGPVGIQPELSNEACRLILKKTDILKENSFLTEEHYQTDFQTAKGDFLHKHQIILTVVSVLITLISLVALGYLAYKSFQPPKRNIAPPASSAIVVPTIALPSPTVAPATGSAAGIEKVSVKIQVLNGTGVSGLATKASDLLKKSGFSTVAAANATVNSPQTLILFSSSVPVVLQTEIVGLFQPLTDSLSSRVADVSPFDVSVTLGGNLQIK